MNDISRILRAREEAELEAEVAAAKLELALKMAELARARTAAQQVPHGAAQQDVYTSSFGPLRTSSQVPHGARYSAVPSAAQSSRRTSSPGAAQSSRRTSSPALQRTSSPAPQRTSSTVPGTVQHSTLFAPRTAAQQDVYTSSFGPLHTSSQVPHGTRYSAVPSAAQSLRHTSSVSGTVQHSTSFAPQRTASPGPEHGHFVVLCGCKRRCAKGTEKCCIGCDGNSENYANLEKHSKECNGANKCATYSCPFLKYPTQTHCCLKCVSGDHNGKCQKVIVKPQ